MITANGEINLLILVAAPLNNQLSNVHLGEPNAENHQGHGKQGVTSNGDPESVSGSWAAITVSATGLFHDPHLISLGGKTSAAHYSKVHDCGWSTCHSKPL